MNNERLRTLLKDLDKIAYELYEKDEAKRWQIGYYKYSIEYFIRNELKIFDKYYKKAHIKLRKNKLKYIND